MSKAVAELRRSLQAQSSVDVDFFGREAQLDNLLRIIELGGTIPVLMGPPNSGKSRLLRRVRELWESKSELKTHLPIFHLDAFATPEVAAEDLAAQMRAHLTWLGPHSMRFKHQEGSSSSFSTTLQQEPVPCLSSVLAWFRSLSLENEDMKPVLIIDHTDLLYRRWPEKDVAAVMRSSAELTKQDRAILILSSSHNFFWKWLEENLQPAEWRPVPVGHFPEATAKAFLSALVNQRVGAGETLPGSWSEDSVYFVCGGCSLLLKTFVREFFSDPQHSLDEAIKGMAAAEMGSVVKGFEKGHSWEPFRYGSVMRLVMEHEAVPLSRVEKADLSCDPKQEVQEMLANDLFHLRYMPPEVFYGDLGGVERGGGIERLYLTPKSPAHLAAMKLYSAGYFDPGLVETVSAAKAAELIKLEGYTFLDVRDPDEFAKSHVENAINLDRGTGCFYDKQRMAELIQKKDRKIVVGGRTDLRRAVGVSKQLQVWGYTNVVLQLPW